MSRNPLFLGLALLLISCNSQEDQLRRAQHEFRKHFTRKEYFEVRLKKEVLNWPLPPLVADAGARLAKAETLEKMLTAIDSTRLSRDQQKQLSQLSAAVHDIVSGRGIPLFDPSRCDVLTDLRRLEQHPEWTLILEKVPEYYQEIEKRWQIPDASLVEPAVVRAQNTLDFLRSKESNEAINAASGSLKDFIGLCWSSWLEK